MENAVVIANYFVKKALADGFPVTLMKLVKLVYIAHGWHLGLTTPSQPLLSEGVQAWKYGPVVPSVYDAFRVNGSSNVTELAATVGPDGRMVYQAVADPGLTQFLDAVWERYKRFDGLQLSALTHQQDTPWYTCWHNEGASNVMGYVIPNNLIASHYHAMADANRARTNAESAAAAA